MWTKRVIWGIVIGSLLVIVLGYIGIQKGAEYKVEHMDILETEYWERCASEGTPLGYSKYIVRFPEGIYVEKAKAKIDSLEAISGAVLETK